MKFGKKLLTAMHPDWASAYVSYKSLKQTLKALATPGSAAQAEGDFVGQLMACIQQASDGAGIASGFEGAAS